MKDILAAPSQAARDQIVLDAVEQGDVPTWFLKWRPITVSAVIDGVPHTLEYQVTPDYVSLGNDEEYFRAPMLPATAQKIADRYGAILPSTRIVDEAYANANAKLIPQTVYPNTGKVSDYSVHEIKVQQQMKTLGLTPGTFLAGHKKDIVVGPNLNGSRVAIYGWHDVSGALTGGKANKAIQPYSTIHDSGYTDYAHGVRLVNKSARLDGNPVDLSTVFADPKLSILVSNQGAFSPRFPNAGSGGSQLWGGGGGSPLGGSIANAIPGVKSVDEAVAEAQAALLSLGYSGVGTADGILGNKTAAAITQFQKDRGLTVNGQLDAPTREALGVGQAEASIFDSPLVWAGLGIAGGAAAFFAYKKLRHR